MSFEKEQRKREYPRKNDSAPRGGKRGFESRPGGGFNENGRGFQSRDNCEKNENGRGFQSRYDGERNENRRSFKNRDNDTPVEQKRGQDDRSDLIIGRNAAKEALKSGRAIDSVLVARGEKTGALPPIIAE